MSARAFPTYPGGKSGNGTYQAIINHIPEIKTLVIPFAGNDGVFQKIKPVKEVWLNDIDPVVCRAWNDVGVTCTNMTAMEILHSLCFGFPDRLIFLDPPYPFEVRKSPRLLYTYEMYERDHIELLEKITAMPEHMIMICSYPNALYDSYLKGWHTCDYLSMTRQGLAVERIYYNYDLSKLKLHDYQYIGKNFRERERFKRIKVNMLRKLMTLPDHLRQSIITDINNELL